MGLTKEEYQALLPEQREEADEKARQIYLQAGADHVVRDIRGVLELVSE